MRRLLASIVLIVCASVAGAQQGTGPVVDDVRSVPTILTVDVDRLFSQSRFGERISQEYASGREALALENRRIADALREEELALAAQRSDMELELFRAEAEAFDAKAQGIRRAQDAKERDLEATLDTAREQFLVVTRPILGQLMVDRGAFAILDGRSVLLSLGSIDVTDTALERINATIGDGSIPMAQDAPDTAPEN